MTTPRPTEVPGLYVLPLPTPFPIGRINTYLALGDRLSPDDSLTLIDAGVNTEKCYQELAAGMAALGVSPGDLDRIIITHHHTDHLGLVDRLAAESGAEVWCHDRCAPYIDTPAEARHHLYQWSLNVWREGGVPQPSLETIGQLFDWLTSLSNGPVTVARRLQDGDRIALAGRDWQVLYTPGHAGDLICLHDAGSGVLLSSDHLLRDVSSNALTEPPEPGQKRPRRLLQYMDQLQRVANLKPRIAYGGHGEPALDVPALVKERLAFHRARADRMLALLRQETLNLYGLTQAMFPHISEAEQFLALSEVLGHLDWLERDALIERVVREGVTCWQAVN